MNQQSKQKVIPSYYKELRTEEDYTNHWTATELASIAEQAVLKGLTAEEYLHILYLRYVSYHTVFNRDNFTCQNAGCKTPGAQFTFHHVKFKKNFKGELRPKADKARNGITLCTICHRGFHAGMQITILKNSKSVFAGHTFRIHKRGNRFLYDRARSKEIIKNNKPKEKIVLSRIKLLLLMHALRHYGFELDLKALEKDYEQNKAFWDVPITLNI